MSRSTLPYEALAEEMATNVARDILKAFERSHENGILSLQEAIHDGIETGLGLAGLQGDISVPDDLVSAYLEGINDATD